MIAVIARACWKTRPTDVNSSLLACNMHVRQFYCVCSYISPLYHCMAWILPFFFTTTCDRICRQQKKISLLESFGTGTFFAIIVKHIGIVAWNLQNWERKPRPLANAFDGILPCALPTPVWRRIIGLVNSNFNVCLRHKTHQNTNICNIV